MKRKVILEVILILLLFYGRANAANRYMATTGVDSGNCSNELSPCLTLQYAFTQMIGGDTLYIEDGVYTDWQKYEKNSIWQYNVPPSGTLQNYTVIRAKNIPCNGLIPCNQPLRVRFTGNAVFDCQGGANIAKHVEFRGIRWDEIQTYAGWDYIYFKQVAAHGVTDGNKATITIGGIYNLLEDVVAFGKGRYKILFYDFSREAQSYGTGNNICRRCIIRHDWAMKNDINPEPIAGISSYYSRGTAILNSIVIDSDTPSEWMENPTELGAAFYQPVDNGPHSFTVKGSLVINTALPAYVNRQGSSGHIINDLVAVRVAGGLGLHGETSVDRVTLIDIGTNNFNYRSATQISTLQAPDDGIYTFREDIQKLFYNSIIRDTLDDGVDGGNVTNDYINMYLIGGTYYVSSLQAANFYTDDPFNNGLKYLPGVEAGSPLSTRGSLNGQIGARILNKLGIDGAFKGDTNWDTEQESLWPWPLESWIRAEMRTSEYTTNPKRGFCANGKGLYGGPITLTSYIWEYLGNSCPPEICSYKRTLPPPNPSAN